MPKRRLKRRRKTVERTMKRIRMTKVLDGALVRALKTLVGNSGLMLSAKKNANRSVREKTRIKA